MEEVPFVVPEEKYPYKPFIPEVVRAIEQPKVPPLLLAEASGGPKESSSSLVVQNLNCKAYLRIVSDNDYDHQVPLAMCTYLRPAGQSIFDDSVCRQCDIENVSRQAHNRFVVDTINAFMKINDVGTSAGKITAPQPPIDSYKEREKEIANVFADKLLATEKAIKYLGERGLLCCKDYEFKDAVERANDEKFTEIVEGKKAKGKVRVTLEGRPPCWWDGKSERDTYGRKLKFEKGKLHTFLTPDIRVVLQDEMQLASDPLLLPPSSSSTTALIETQMKSDQENSFDKLPTETTALLIQ